MFTFLSGQALASAALLLAAAAGCMALRRGSAAHRHFVWVLAFSAMLVLPVCAWLVGPLMPRGSRPASAPVVMVDVGVAKVLQEAGPRPGLPAPRVPWAAVAGWIWAAGTALLLARAAAGLLICERRRRDAVAAPDATAVAREVSAGLQLRRPVDVRLSEEVSVPETFGLRSPIVLLPSAADEWPPDRLRVVLLHELFHIKRHDWVAHLAAFGSAALFWFNPLSWYGLARLRDERETACDDEVLRHGVAHSEYAGELVAIAKGCRPAASPLAISMGSPANLERRVRAILNPHVNRRRLTMRQKFFTFIPALLLITAATLVTAPAQTRNAKVSGVVTDASGARVPGVEVLISSGGAVETVRTDPAGGFEFAAIPDGTYVLKVMAPGFKLLEIPDVAAKASAPAYLNLKLEIGSISERVTITAQGQPREQPPIASTALEQAGSPARPRVTFASVVAEPPASAAGKQRLRVGGNVRPSKLINGPKPEYPAYLAAQGVEGTAIVEAIVGTEGQVLSVKPKNSQVNADLMRAAVEAVGEWKYEPTLLNGRPVEVVTTVTFEFRLRE